MPIYDYVCSCGNRFEALIETHRTPAPRCPDCGSEPQRRPAGGAALLGHARLPANPGRAPASWEGTYRGDREYVAAWRRSLDARAVLDERNPEIAVTRSPVLAHEGRFEGAPLTLDDVVKTSPRPMKSA